MGRRLTASERNRWLPTVLALGRVEQLSQHEIARRTGLSQPTIRRMLLTAPADAVPATQVDVLPAAAGHVRARASVRTQAEGADWLEHARGFLEVLRQLAESPTASATERRLAAEHGAELALSAFDYTAEMREQEAAT